MGPIASKDEEAGVAPLRLIRLKVGLKPAMPQQAAGTRMEPPVSVPTVKVTSPAATDAALPLDEPPVISFGNSGFNGVPK